MVAYGHGKQARPVLALLMAGALAVVGCASGSTDPATGVTDVAATLRAHGKTGGDNPTKWWFEYGKTTSYGTKTPQHTAGTSTAQQNVSERVTGLTPDTTYHYRACASNSAGSGCTADATFRTGSPGLLPGFQETTAFSNLEAPTAVRVAPDGRIFVAEKPGGIKVFDGLGDTTPTTFANLRSKVNHNWDRGLLGLALDPDFPAKPFVYVLYTHDAPIGGTAPTFNDECPDPPGPTTHGCVVSARLSRLQAQGNQMVGAEQVLIEDWCQQFPSHSIGDLRFGPDGALYASGGDGASFDFVDYGQNGIPRNPCGDPPAAVGGAQSPPTSEGGALRSQDLRTTADPTSLDGTIVRVNPDTGEALPTNPLAGRSDPNARRIIAHGFRNPFRFAFRPGTRELWVGDVGWNNTEEINRITDTADATVENFGWPCWEGPVHQGGYDAANLSLCESLYSAGGASSPVLSYAHSAKVTPEDTVSRRRIVDLGHGLQPLRGVLPSEFDGALFFADATRGCIWVMERGTGRVPTPGGQVVPLRRDAAGRHPVRPWWRPPLRRRIGQPDQAHPLHARQPGAPRRSQRRRPPGRHPAGRELRRHGSSDPDGDSFTMPGTSTATAPTTTRPRRAPRSDTRRAARTWSACA